MVTRVFRFELPQAFLASLPAPARAPLVTLQRFTTKLSVVPLTRPSAVPFVSPLISTLNPSTASQLCAEQDPPTHLEVGLTLKDSVGPVVIQIVLSAYISRLYVVTTREFLISVLPPYSNVEEPSQSLWVSS